jgi:uncharacterized membrane protein YhaH (DUF805 family)
MFSILADATTDQATTQTFAALGAFMGTFLIIGLIFIVLTVWLFWRIFAKAGFNGALGLLCLIPSVGFLICILILAFGTWPNQANPPGSSMTMT